MLTNDIIFTEKPLVSTAEAIVKVREILSVVVDVPVDFYVS